MLKSGNNKRFWLIGITVVVVLAIFSISNDIFPYHNTSISFARNQSVKNNDELNSKPVVEVPFDLSIEENEQKSVDAGHSPWRLDPAFVAQVFLSLKVSPEGIVGEYPIKYEDLKIVQNNGKLAIVEVTGDKTTIKTVYLERLIRQDSTGIWTVVGYDPINKK